MELRPNQVQMSKTRAQNWRCVNHCIAMINVLFYRHHLQRYHYYVRDGVNEADLAPFPTHTLPAVHSRLAPSLLSNPEWSALVDSLHEEIIAVGSCIM